MVRHNVSKEEVQEWVAEAVKDGIKEIRPLEHCAAKGLSSGEVETLRKIIKALDGTAVTIGRTVIVAIVLGIVGLVSLGFWEKLGK